MNEETEKAITNVLRDRKKRVQVFLTAMARKHIERIMFLISKFPMVEDELFKKERLDTVKTSDLIRLFTTMANQVQDNSEFLRAFVSNDELRSDPLPGRGILSSAGSGDTPEEASEITEEEKEIATELSTQSRRRVQSVVRRFLDVMNVSASEKKKSTEPSLKHMKTPKE
jgi:hypothetical protein